MRKYGLSTLAAVLVIGLGVVGSVVGVAAILGQAAVAISMGIALLTTALVVAYGWTGAVRTQTAYW